MSDENETFIRGAITGAGVMLMVAIIIWSIHGAAKQHQCEEMSGGECEYRMISVEK